MNDDQQIYKRQYKNAIITLEKLEKRKEEVDLKLQSNPICSHLHKDLREVNLDIKITLNEIEHLESHLQECEL